jgi:hypothetical protein
MHKSKSNGSLSVGKMTSYEYAAVKSVTLQSAEDSQPKSKTINKSPTTKNTMTC